MKGSSFIAPSRMAVFRPDPSPKALRTHISRLLGSKTVLYRAFGLF